MDDTQRQFFSMLMRQLPFIVIPVLTMIGGVIVAIVYMSKYPREATLTLLAMLLMLGSTIMGPVLSAMHASQPRGGDMNQFLSSLLNYGRQFVSTGGFVLLFVAIFGNRTPKDPDSYDE